MLRLSARLVTVASFALTAATAGHAMAAIIYTAGTDNTFGSFDTANLQYTQISANLGGGHTYNLTPTGTGALSLTQNSGVTNDTFGRVTTTGTVTIIGASQGMGDAIFGLARRPSDGAIFGYGGNTASVGTVNPTTGVYTQIGSAGKPAAGFGGGFAFIGNTVYAFSSDGGGSLHTVNTTTGVFSAQIGSSNANYVSGAAFSDGTNLFDLSGTNLYQVNPSTGNLSLLGALTGTGTTSAFYAASPVAIPEPAAAVVGVMAALGLTRRTRRPSTRA